MSTQKVQWYSLGHSLKTKAKAATLKARPQIYQDCTNSVPIVKNSQKTVKTAKMTIGVPIVTGLPRLYQQCTNRQKQSKDSQNSKNDHWCTKSSQGYQDCTKCNNSLPIEAKAIGAETKARQKLKYAARVTAWQDDR